MGRMCDFSGGSNSHPNQRKKATLAEYFVRLNRNLLGDVAILKLPAERRNKNRDGRNTISHSANSPTVHASELVFASAV